MNRKLHNSLTALMTSAAVLVLGVIAATPLPPQPASAFTPGVVAVSEQFGSDLIPAQAALDQFAASAQADVVAAEIDSLADAAALTAEIATATALAAAFPQASSAAQIDHADQEPSRQTRKTTRRHRQTLVMPFFSFAPRG